MKKFIQNKLKEQKGLTLIELLAVIVIIAIIAAIAIPAIGNIIQNSRVEAVKADALNVISAAKLYETENGDIGSTGIKVSKLMSDGFLDDAGKIPTTSDVFTGPALTATVPSIIGSNGITFTKATSAMVNDAGSASELRVELEAGAVAIP